MSFLKILVIGDVGTGKTSLVNRIVYNSFSEKYKATVGCEFGMKIMEI
jgi:GTPase SAR1 family protein